MKTVKILETRKDEILEKTMNCLQEALAGDCAHRYFFFKIDEKTKHLTVDYYLSKGAPYSGENCFCKIPEYMLPEDEKGLDTYDYEGFIENQIVQKIEMVAQHK